MKSAITAALIAVLPAALGAETSEFSDPAPILAMGAYVPTDDIDVSVAFYRALFDETPAITLPDFVAFDVAGGWFAVVSRERYAPGAEPGSGAVPYLQASNLEELQDRVSAIGGPAPEIIEEPGIHLLKITDPNGQLVEFFKLTGQ